MEMQIGKPTTCNECETLSRVLELRGKGELWSKCLNCGFEEWEWLFGDNPDYLNYLATVYQTTVKKIWEAVTKTTKTPP